MGRGGPSGDGRFRSTRWSLVAAAGAADGERARAALAELCQTYWYPLYAFVRRGGVPAADAEDVVQGFFARLIEKRDLARVVRGQGHFRSFLRVAVRNHLAGVRASQRALKRGGGQVRLAVDFDDAAERFEREAPLDESPERAFDRSWAVGLMERALAELREEYASSGRGAVFEALVPFVQAGFEEADPSSVAARLNMSAGAVRVAVHRLRQRFQACVRRSISETLADEGDVDAELEELFRALGP